MPGSGRPLERWSWPSSGSAPVWALAPAPPMKARPLARSRRRSIFKLSKLGAFKTSHRIESRFWAAAFNVWLSIRLAARADGDLLL